MPDQGRVEEERLTPAWKVGCVLVASLVAMGVGWFLITMFNVTHDYSVNSRIQMLWIDPKGVPLGVVLRANNRWMENAFIADASQEDGKKIAVLMLDDHYRSGDGTLRSESGVIGDPVSRAVLCSVPGQAKAQNVELDEVVKRLIASECR